MIRTPEEWEAVLKANWNKVFFLGSLIGGCCREVGAANYDYGDFRILEDCLGDGERAARRRWSKGTSWYFLVPPVIEKPGE